MSGLRVLRHLAAETGASASHNRRRVRPVLSVRLGERLPQGLTALAQPATPQALSNVTTASSLSPLLAPESDPQHSCSLG